MVKTYEGSLVARGARFAILCTRFNQFVTNSLLEGALDALRRHGAAEEAVEVVWVPGAFELPVTAKRLAQEGRYDAIICLGVVIRGATAHFDYVSGEAASGIAAASRETGVPMSFGVLTTDTLEQAIERAGTKAGNKGAEAALAAIEMANLFQAFKG